MPLTSADIVSKVRRVELRTSKLANDLMVGAYHSQFKGRGMDFEELREYVPGDDVRTIDWNVTARMRRPFVKLHREERELSVMLVIDVSASGEFGSSSRTKRESAAEVAGILAFSALRNGDKVGLLLFSDDVELFLPPRKGRRHLLRVIREALLFPPRKRGTSIQSALAFLNHVIHRRSVVFLVTDFLHSFGVTTGRRDLFHEIGQTNARHDLVCIQLQDRRERDVPPAGLLTLEDAETGEVLELDTVRDSVRGAFSEGAAHRQEQLDRALMQAGVDLVRLTPEDEYAPMLQRFFEHRRRR
ncbi:MAG: DUF58 domain-containing protein [Chthoniobacteraceae bacterium]